MKTTETTREELGAAADAVSCWVSWLAEMHDKTIEQTLEDCRNGVHGDTGRAAAEVLYAGQYDGIIGDCVERWTAAGISRYSYTIFDVTPARGDINSRWPSATGVVVFAADPESVWAVALARAESEGRACGEYSAGDRLWVTVWDAAGCHLGDRFVCV